MARPKKLKIADVIAALNKTHGLKTLAADVLGVNYKTLQRYIVDSVAAQEVVEANGKKRRDIAESKLDEAINRGESWAVMFTLKNARDREYSDKIFLEGGAHPLEIVAYRYGEGIRSITPPDVARLEAGPGEDSPASGAGEGAGGGQALRQDDPGGQHVPG